jgi:hypothetical protein
MATQAALFTRALSKVGAVGSGQTASAEDVAIARAALPLLIAQIEALQITTIPITDDEDDDTEIPNELFEELAKNLVLFMREEFGGSAVSDAEKMDALTMLRRICTVRASGEVQRAEYF